MEVGGGGDGCGSGRGVCRGGGGVMGVGREEVCVWGGGDGWGARRGV